ncbi:zinc-ribbon domain-containing protein [Hominifimenecus sp. rT4P-3]|uniref:zinc-ribbon domain-containing protein n=1 Tax=Hominifimenecus sp. rT4P-3 TaxID=3242979 RepID=UPI003DA52364
MYCVNCGKKLPNHAKVCDHCGMPVGEYKPEADLEENPYVSGYYDGSDGRSQQTTYGDSRYDEGTKNQNATYGYSNSTQSEWGSYGAYEEKPPLRSGGLAIAALVLCILGAVSCCAPYVSIPICIAGIVCGALGLKSDRRTMALVSLIISIVFLVISIALLIYAIALIPYMEEYLEEYGYIWR